MEEVNYSKNRYHQVRYIRTALKFDRFIALQALSLRYPLKWEHKKYRLQNTDSISFKLLFPGFPSTLESANGLPITSFSDAQLIAFYRIPNILEWFW